MCRTSQASDYEMKWPLPIIKCTKTVVLTGWGLVS